MKHETIIDKARVWTITSGPDGLLRAELDERLLATLDPTAHALVISASRNEAPDRSPA